MMGLLFWAGAGVLIFFILCFVGLVGIVLWGMEAPRSGEPE